MHSKLYILTIYVEVYALFYAAACSQSTYTTYKFHGIAYVYYVSYNKEAVIALLTVKHIGYYECVFVWNSHYWIDCMAWDTFVKLNENYSS